MQALQSLWRFLGSNRVYWYYDNNCNTFGWISTRMRSNFDERELFQPDGEPLRKPLPRRFKGDQRYEALGSHKIHTHSPCIVCGESANGKPYCIKHLDLLPYVQQVKAGING